MSQNADYGLQLIRGQLWFDPTGKWATVKVIDFGADWALVSDPDGRYRRYVGPEQFRAMTQSDGSVGA